MKSALAAAVILLALMLNAGKDALAQAFDTAAPYAILVEAGTGEVLFEKNADAPFEPASMAKMMTIYIAFDLIKKGELNLTDTAMVSTEAWRKWRLQGSTMFLKAGDSVTIEELLHGIIVHSGNDATAVLAEALAGSESLFVDWMNDKALEIGMTNSVFYTTNGWPASGQQVTARDLATLALRTAVDFPDLYAFYAEKSFTYGVDPKGAPITQSNRNPVLYNVEGGDGLKTGHTEEAGYGLTASAIRDGRRVILVLGGMTGSRQRSSEAQRLLEYAFRNFRTYKLFQAGQTVENAPVWLGQEGAVPLVVEKDVAITLSRMDRNRMVAKVVYDSPVPAPIEKGQALGRIVISVPDRPDRIVPLVSANGVEEIGAFGRLGALFSYLVFGSTAAKSGD